MRDWTQRQTRREGLEKAKGRELVLKLKGDGVTGRKRAQTVPLALHLGTGCAFSVHGVHAHRLF